MNIAIINTWLVTFRGGNLGIVEDGAIGIEDKRIIYVGPTEGFDYKKADKIIDGTNKVTMPGLINSHIHTGITLLRGGAQDVPEIEWMNKTIGPFYNYVTQEDLVAGSKLGVIEGLRSGTTTFCEYTSDVVDLVDQVYLPFKTRVVAIETINEVSRNRAHLKPTDLYEYDKNKGEEAFKRNRELYIKYSNQELVSCMYGPQALDMISLDLLQNIKEQALEQQTSVHMHIAQGERERLQIVGRYGEGASTVKVLFKYDLLGKHLIGAHCHDTTADERKLMVSEGTRMVGCPSSISMIDGIVPPIHHFVELGGNVGLGSDQAPGPGTHNMFREMHAISLLTKTMLKDPTALPAWKVLHLATKGGAKVMGLDEKIGCLEVGKMADIITIDLNNPHLIPVISKPFRTFVPNLVYSATGNEVDNVIINGKIIISEGKFTEIDEQKIMNDANKRAKRIFEVASEDWIKADSELVKKVEEGWL